MAEVARGQQYGQRQAAEERLRAVPIAEGADAPPAAPAQGGPNVLDVAAGYNPPTGLMSMPEQGIRQMPGAGMAPPSRLPQGNVDAMAYGPLLPGLVAMASLPGVSGSFRNWVRMLQAQTPPEVTFADMLGS